MYLCPLQKGKSSGLRSELEDGKQETNTARGGGQAYSESESPREESTCCGNKVMNSSVCSRESDGVRHWERQKDVFGELRVVAMLC